MHALAVTVTIDESHLAEAQQELENTVVPRVKQAPGLISGYWLAPAGGKGFSLLLFENEEQANGGAAMARNSNPPDFVRFDTIEVRQVIAQV